MSRKKIVIALLFVFGFTISGVILFNHQNARADDCVGSTCTGGDNNDMNQGCVSGYCIADRFGGSWIYYDFTGEQIANRQVTISAPNNNTGVGTHTMDIGGCLDAGATGYYRSAEIFRYVATGQTKNPPEQWALKPNSEYDLLGGPVVYRPDLGTPWATVRSAYDAAAAHVTPTYSWEEVSIFCYSPAWGGGTTPPRPTPSPASGDGHFESFASVSAIPGGDVPGDIDITASTGIDGTAEIRFSTDRDSVSIQFHHFLGYKSTKKLEITEDSEKHKDTISDVDTTYTITQYRSDGGSSNIGGGSLGAKNNESVGSSDMHPNAVPVTLSPGQTVTVCQTISYSKKNFSFTWKKVDTHYHPSTMSYDEIIDLGNYDASGSGSGNSRVCATVTRPADPSGSGPTGPTGSSGSNVMMAGETSDIGWNVSGPNYDVRRLKEYQGIVYNYDVNYDYSSYLVTGASRSGSDPCGFYTGKGGSNCGVIDGIAGSFGGMGSSHGFGESRNIVVPDFVGRKYCHSWGYRYEYYYYSSSKGGWNGPYDGYWYNYNSSCRTIAKKPSVAIWNGSTLTNSSVTTSLSYRYDNAVMGAVSSSGGSRTNYGSWSEYLNVIGSTLSGFTSGAALSENRAKSSDIYPNSSRLTITNNTTNLGGSGVQTNSTLRTRMVTYLRNQAEPLGDTLAGLTTSTTRIFHRKGDLYITGDIILSPTHYATIYQLPQVVIFVDGNVYIDSNVNRIDAWIVAGNENTGTGGIIDTCRQFVSGSTEADALNRMLPGGNNCAKQLVFNGPVFANKLLLHRSFGSDPIVSRYGVFGSKGSAGPTKYNPAEIFNLNANTYLWAYAQAGRYESSYTESYSRELAPRY